MNWLSASCKIVEVVNEKSKRLVLVISFPCTKQCPLTSPLVIFGIRPLRQRPIVDLPLPEGPAKRIFSPLLIFKLIFLRVGSAWLLYLNEKSLNSIIGSVIN